MTQSTIALTLGNITIRQQNGLFSLNDLHKAAGGEARHKPSEWLRNQQAQELVQEIGKAGIPALDVKKGGKNPGAYACRELVIAYAAWINAAFHLKVIRVFLAVTVPQPTRPHNPAIDYDRISPAQKQDLKEIVDAIVAAGKQTHGETWARLHNKFRINSYHELPATRHLEARAYLLAKLPQPNPDNVMDAATPPPQPEETVQDMVARWVNIIDSNSRIINTQAIFQPIVDALERQSGKPPAPTADTIQAAYATAAKTAAAVQAQVFHAILQGHSPHALAA